MKYDDFLYVMWESPLSGKNYVIGKLTRADGFSFEYTGDYEVAKLDGWTMIQTFPETKTYYSKDLFPAFSRRLPDKKRRNITQVLNKYGLEKYDGYELLKKSGGKLPIDTYSFAAPMV